uniref:beta-fructofuranosidase n=1 Tax=Leersia perrieri TaxID=77586 RepID=A0A0D9WAT8_9ORYZ
MCPMNGKLPLRDGRTAYHFQPAKFWQNGPLYHNGLYHFFFQYNPHGPLWDKGKLSWGHSVSGDLVNWSFLGTAIDPTEPFDINGCWSGSATVLPGGRPAFLYTGLDAGGAQVQNVAFAKDPLLRDWEKPRCNPVIPIPYDVTRNNFRDPSTAWVGRDGLWRMIVAGEVAGAGSVLVYRSEDFLRWERNAAPMHSSAVVPVLECPDFFPVAAASEHGLDTSASGAGVKHVLKVSEFDTHQDFYMWLWVNEYDTTADDVAKGWAGVQAFPRKVWLDSDGKQLLQWPVDEIETLRTRRVGLQGTEVKAGGLHEIVGIASNQADVEVVFEILNLEEEAESFDPEWLDPHKLCKEKGTAFVRGGVGPFGLIVMSSGDLKEQTAVFFRVFKHQGKYKVFMCTDLTRSSTKEDVYKDAYGGFVDVDIEKDKSISLRTLIDHSMVESFGGGGRACITTRVYPEHAATSNSHLYVFNNGSGRVNVSKLEAWEMAAATVNVADADLAALNAICGAAYRLKSFSKLQTKSNRITLLLDCSAMALAGLTLAVLTITVHLCFVFTSSSPPVCPANAHHFDRTAYHFQPAKNWQNGAAMDSSFRYLDDSNHTATHETYQIQTGLMTIRLLVILSGPVYYNGMYHLFYQYNPHGALWDTGNLSWGHSVSGDLVNWAALDNALDPTAPFDANGCASGSVTILADGLPVIMYSGIDAQRRQVQNIAFPKNPHDPLLREWTKTKYNPVVSVPADVSPDSFRDPTTAWRGRDGAWRFAVSAVSNGVGATLVYRSRDFLRWERNAAPLHASRGDKVMAECPDLFPVTERGQLHGVRHVLKLSMPDTLEDYYMVGVYDDTDDTFTVPPEDLAAGGFDYRRWRRIDHGHLYASKTFFDAIKNRRVLWAWVNESDSEADDVAKGWSGLQSFPRVVWLDESGKQLVQWPVEEIETLRRKRGVLLGGGNEVEAGGLREIGGIAAATQADVEVVFEIASLAGAERLETERLHDPDALCREKGAAVRGGIGPFGLLVMASGDLREHTAVFFRVFRVPHGYTVLMCTDLTRSSTRSGVYKPTHGGFVDIDIEKDKAVSLRTLIDHSIVESYGGGGRICMTARVYPEHVETSRSYLYVFNNASNVVKVSKLDAWELAMASVNVGDDGLISGGSVCDVVEL